MKALVAGVHGGYGALGETHHSNAIRVDPRVTGQSGQRSVRVHHHGEGIELGLVIDSADDFPP